MKKCIVLIVVLSVPCSLVFVVGCQPGEYKDPATGEVIPKEQFNQLPPADQEKYEPTTPDPLDGAEGVMAVLSPFAAFEPISAFVVGLGSAGIPLIRKVRKLVPEAKAAWEIVAGVTKAKNGGGVDSVKGSDLESALKETTSAESKELIASMEGTIKAKSKAA